MPRLATHGTFSLLVLILAFARDAWPQTLSGDFWNTHDPSIAKEGKTWYVFATGRAPGGGQLPIRCSEDLRTWRACGQVFEHIPEWIHEKSPGTKDLWAPDISRAGNEYRLYYAYSLFGSNTSGIGLATNRTLDAKSPEYVWMDKGLVLASNVRDIEYSKNGSPTRLESAAADAFAVQ